MVKKILLGLAGLMLIAGVFALTGCEQGGVSTGGISGLNVSNQQNGIWVSGQGQVSAAPDIAVLQLGISAENESVAEARSQASGAMENVMKALSGSGIAEKDIQTSYFSIQKVTRWDNIKQQEVATGYLVTNMVTVKVRNIETAGTVIDSVVDAGGNLTRVNSISFTIDDPTLYYAEARKEAMDNAGEIASQLAKLSGVSLGKVTYVSESAYYAPMSARAAGIAYDESASYKTSVSPGELDISINVQVAYAIK